MPHTMLPHAPAPHVFLCYYFVTSLLFCLQDVIWMSSKRVVGKKAFSSFVQQMREAYPDLSYEVGQVRVLTGRWGCVQAGGC